MTCNTHLVHVAKRVYLSIMQHKTTNPSFHSEDVVTAPAYGALRYGVATFGRRTNQWRAKRNVISKRVLQNAA